MSQIAIDTCSRLASVTAIARRCLCILIPIVSQTAISRCAAQALVDTSRFTASGISVTIAHSSDARAFVAEATNVIRAGLDEYVGVFGGPPRDGVGQASRALTVRLSVGVSNEGDSDPGIVSLTIAERPLFGFYSWQLVLLHELFHLWSAGSFRYQDDREQWFNEGATEYYTLRTATRRGFVRPETAPAIAAMAAGFYASAPGLGRLSLREAGRTPANKRANYFLVYHGGWMAATLIDVDLRRRSNGTRSLDDLLRWLYQNRDAQTRRYTLDDLVTALRTRTGRDYGQFVSQYIDGTTTLPLSAYVDFGGAAFDIYRQKAIDELQTRGRTPPVQRPQLEPAVAGALGITSSRP